MKPVRAPQYHHRRILILVAMVDELNKVGERR